MARKLTYGIVSLALMFCVPAYAGQFDVATVLARAAQLQTSRGYVSNHVEGGHTHFDITASDGTLYEICPHPKMGLLHVMQGQALPGARLVIEIDLDNNVKPYNKNPFTSLIYYNKLSRSGLTYMADKAMKTIMDTPK
ncbi:hypothetical protein [uncultured Hoeflea sp.]|uniref:hypothetical protein n=1 Tax=uncultured Hoeflea sp. TaxID=538666 RepID=UPI0030DDAFF8|tara:strand:+ start:2101 stop:2514 length:414 start_codon:yes stop_codon:yes gene_type:complete